MTDIDPVERWLKNPYVWAFGIVLGVNWFKNPMTAQNYALSLSLWIVFFFACCAAIELGLWLSRLTLRELKRWHRHPS